LEEHLKIISYIDKLWHLGAIVTNGNVQVGDRNTSIELCHEYPPELTKFGKSSIAHEGQVQIIEVDGSPQFHLFKNLHKTEDQAILVIAQIDDDLVKFLSDHSIKSHLCGEILIFSCDQELWLCNFELIANPFDNSINSHDPNDYFIREELADLLGEIPANL
jgi:hypothetical protein